MLGTKETQFKGTPQSCEECHADKHGGQFVAKTGKTPCADCHNVARWVPSTFDHDKRTPFPLQGGHANVKCDLCHKTFRMISGTDILFYKPTPQKCAECHVTDPGPLKPNR
jgi:hypothetical protein